MVEQQVAAVLGRLDDAGVPGGADGEPERPADAGRPEGVDGHRDGGRVAVEVPDRDGAVRRGAGDADHPRPLVAVEHGRVLGLADAERGLLQTAPVEVRRATGGVVDLAPAEREGHPELDQRQHPALHGPRSRRRAGRPPRPGRGWWPSTTSRAGPRSRRACGRRGASSGGSWPRPRSTPTPSSLIGASSRSRWFIEPSLQAADAERAVARAAAGPRRRAASAIASTSVTGASVNR